MKKINVCTSRFLVALLAVTLACGSLFAAVSSAKQLEKGKQLYAQEKDNEAMDMFIDVLVNGTRAEVEEANRYINLIHNRMGGIQDPVLVDVNYQEGSVARLQGVQNPSVLQEQWAAETASVQNDIRSAGLAATAEADALAMSAQEQSQAAAAKLAQQRAAAENAWQEQVDLYNAEKDAWNQTLGQYGSEAATWEAQANQTAQVLSEQASSTYTDLTSPSAIQARQIYTSQKLESMKQAAIAKLQKEKGVRLYFRNNEPDAIDIDSEVLFEGSKFRADATPVLEEIYTLMALTQGAGYVILPPGSYTDNITLSGIRQAMALNSYLVHKGLSSGKISYNMGLFDEEPPAKFANLEGVSIVFDYDAQLPAALPDASSVTSLPLLSMAVVPVSNQIDPSAAEAFAIDFSVIETNATIESWVFQIIQQGKNDTYYVVRQLGGFSPVYHQILWNARKGIIGPELACGKYTLALTATDVEGGKRTLRRQVEVLCSGKQAAAAKQTATSTSDNLNYKTARLWTKPARIMKEGATTTTTTTTTVVEETEVVDPYAVTTNSYDVNTAQTGTNGYTTSSYNSNSYNYTMNSQTTTQTTGQGVTNPYGVPAEDEYGL